MKHKENRGFRMRCREYLCRTFSLRNILVSAYLFGTVFCAMPQHVADNGDGTFTNPVIFADVPDPDIIRVGDYFYMVSTTMHFSPGCGIMKSRDLVNWEIVNYAYDVLDPTDRFALKNGENDYSNGSWAANLRYDPYEGMYYIIMTCNTTGKTYFFVTDDIENGKWHVSTTDKCYDPGLLFEDTGKKMKKYVLHPSDSFEDHAMYLREMKVDKNWNVSVGKPVKLIDYANLENPARGLRAEGYHAYKHNGWYYVFMIQGKDGQRQEIVWRSRKLKGGDWEGKLLFGGEMVNGKGEKVLPTNGIAQGGMVDTPDGKWWCYLFKDYGALGRMPVLFPLEWSEDGWPVVGENGLSAGTTFTKPVQGTERLVLFESDEFNEPVQPVSKSVFGARDAGPKLCWQWNHVPDPEGWSLTDRQGWLRLKPTSTASDLRHARNTLTQRTYGPRCSASVKMDASGMKDGDVAGLASFQNQYGFVGVRKDGSGNHIIMHRATAKDDATGKEIVSLPLAGNDVWLRVDHDFSDLTDRAVFFYSLDGKRWHNIGDTLQMRYDWPDFCGYRYAIFDYATKTTGGHADFDYFKVEDTNPLSLVDPMPSVPAPLPVNSQPIGNLDGFEEYKLDLPIASGPFKANWESIETNYPGTPEWLRDAKFGIWVHFGPQSAGESGDWYARNLYNENHHVYSNHNKNFGHPSEIGYKDILRNWNPDKLDPEFLTKLYHKAGARFLMIQGVHHDNYDLWNSKYQPWNSVKIGPKRDLLREWVDACGKVGMRYGVTFHHEYTWWWWQTAFGSDSKGEKAGVPYDGNLTLSDGIGKWWEGYDPRLLYGVDLREYETVDHNAHNGWAPPKDGIFTRHTDFAKWYVKQWAQRIMDVTDNYDPDFIYTDGTVQGPFTGTGTGTGFVANAMPLVMADFYNKTLKNRGKVDVFSIIKFRKPTNGAVNTAEFDFPQDIITDQPWIREAPVGDWFYAPGFTYDSGMMIRFIIESIARDGNAALNICLQPDGSIDPDCVKMLEEVGEWMDKNGEAVYGSKAWHKLGEGEIVDGRLRTLPGGGLGKWHADFKFSSKDFRFTVGKNGSLYAFCMTVPDGGSRLNITSLAKGGKDVPAVRSVSLLGYDGKLNWRQTSKGLSVVLPEDMGDMKSSLVFKID